MQRKASYIVARIAGLVTVSVLALLYAVQTPAVQTRLSSRAIDSITEALDGKVSYGTLKLMPSGALLMTDILITDGSPCTEDARGRAVVPADTVLTARSLTATFTLAGLLRHEGLHLGRVSLDSAYFHLVIEPNEYGTNISRIFGLLSDKEKKPQQGRLFDLRKFSADGIHYRMTNLVEAPTGEGKGIDFGDLDLSADIRGRSISFADGILRAHVPSVSLSEKSGYRLDRLSADVSVGNGKTMVSDIEIDDPWSRVRAEYFSMTYEDASAFEDFVHNILMELRLRRSRLSLRTLTYFTGAFGGSGTLLDLQAGHMKGYVDDLAIDGLVFADGGSGISGVLDGRLTGLPDFGSSLLEASLGNCRFTFRGAETLVRDIAPETDISLSGISPGVSYILDATASGPVGRLSVKAGLKSEIGSLETEGEIRNLADSSRALMIAARLISDGLDLGTLTGSGALGALSAETSVRAVLYPDSPEIYLDNLTLKGLDAAGYHYHSIGASGSLAGGRARISLSSADPNLLLEAKAAADIGDSGTARAFVMDASVGNLDLHALGLDERTISRVAADLSADLVLDGQYINGEASISSLAFESAAGRSEIGDIDFRAYNFAAEQNIRMTAPFARLSLTAGASPAQFLEDLQQLTLRRELPALYPEQKPLAETSSFHLDIETGDTRELLSFVAPGMYIADGTSLCLEILDNGELIATVNSGRIAFRSNFLKDLDLRADNIGESLNLAVSGSSLKAGNFEIQSPEISGLAYDDMLELALNFDGIGGIGGSGRFLMDADIARDSTNTLIVKAHPLESYIDTDSGRWTFNESDITLHEDSFSIRNFGLAKGGQSISVNGGFSSRQADTLDVDIHGFDLSLLDAVVALPGGIRGRAEGSASLHSGPDRTPGMLLDLRLDSLEVAGTALGRIEAESSYEEGGDALEIYVRNDQHGRDVIFAKGMYFPVEKRFDLSAMFDEFPVTIAGALLPDVLSGAEGSISGDVNLRNVAGTLHTGSNGLRLNSVQLTPKATGVRYTIDGPLSLDGDALHFDTLTVADSDGGSGTVAGKVDFSDPGRLSLDTELTLQNLKVLDLVQGSEGVYGLLRASGNASLSGPVNSLVIDAGLSTSGPGNIHIPTFGSATGTTSDLLTFTRREVSARDDYELMLEELTHVESRGSDIQIRARLGIQPGVRAYVEMDKSSGNMASLSAQGNLTLNLRPSQDIMDITGDLTVNEGEYQFSIPGILSKEFTIQQGSSIRFVGNLPDTRLDIDAVYSLKASLEALIPDSTEGLKRTVNCGINISDRLRNPRMSFSIDVPDLNPTARSQVESALSTDDKVQKQFVALLVLGSFMPDESSGIIDSNDILLSNVTSFMAGQLNSILQKLEIPVDIGIDYHNSASTGSNIFDVAISTQLFNNRVIVGGSVANRGYANTMGAQQGDVIGDLDIQIKLDPEGKYRFNMFSHSADEYSSILDMSQRNGVGFSFQKEYYRFSDFLRSIFAPKEAAADSTARAGAPKEMTTIRIENEER